MKTADEATGELYR